MLRRICFGDTRFKKQGGSNLLELYTKNTIILCNNCKIMHTLADEIINTINEKTEYNDYDCDDEDIGRAKNILRFGLQRIIEINGQYITLALEPSIIYKADTAEDIWFADWQGVEGNAENPYLESIYPMLIFKGSREIWNQGKDEVYKMICNGRYGTYDGNWVVLKR